MGRHAGAIRAVIALPRLGSDGIGPSALGLVLEDLRTGCEAFCQYIHLPPDLADKVDNGCSLRELFAEAAQWRLCAQAIWGADATFWRFPVRTVPGAPVERRLSQGWRGKACVRKSRRVVGLRYGCHETARAQAGRHGKCVGLAMWTHCLVSGGWSHDK